MKRSGILCASVVAAASVVSADGAFAVTKPNTFKFAATDIVASVDCTAKGGSVSTNADISASKTCTLPAGSNSLNFAPADTIAATDCTSKGGTVTTSTNGDMVCTKPATGGPVAPSREPTN